MFILGRGYAFERPLLSSYEAEVALQAIEWQSVYPMDYYRKDGGNGVVALVDRLIGNFVQSESHTICLISRFLE